MNKLIVALLASGLMGSALAQSASPPSAPASTPASAPASTPASVQGAAHATGASLGSLQPIVIAVGVTAVGVAVVAATSRGGHQTTGTTGTH